MLSTLLKNTHSQQWNSLWNILTATFFHALYIKSNWNSLPLFHIPQHFGNALENAEQRHIGCIVRVNASEISRDWKWLWMCVYMYIIKVTCGNLGGVFRMQESFYIRLYAKRKKLAKVICHNILRQTVGCK